MGSISNIPGTITLNSLPGTISSPPGSVTANGAFPILAQSYLYSGITFTRNSTKTYFDSTGTLQTAAVNEWPVEYDPSTLAYRGRSAWESRTCANLWNRDLTNAAWTKSNTTAAKTATGIDGVANSASTLTATAANGTCLQSITLASSARFQTAYIKRRTGSGTIEMTMDNGTTWTAVTVTASWTRVSIPAQTLANPTVGFRIVTSGDEVDIDFVQNENGTFATPVIKTTTAAATRLADSAVISGSAFSGWYNQSQGTFLYEFSIGSTGGSSARRVGQVDDGSTSNNEIRFGSYRPHIDNLLGAFMNNGGATQFDETVAGVIAAGTNYKAAFAYAANNSIFAEGGSLSTLDSSCSIPTPAVLRIGGGNATLYLNGWISSLSYYPVRLGNSSPQALTA